MLIKSKFPLEISRNDELTALCIACSKKEHFPLVKRLLDAGADINFTTSTGISPLYMALMNINN